MKFPIFKTEIYSIFALIAAIPSIGIASPDLAPDPNANVIYVRMNCSIANVDAAESPIENCFESTATAMTFARARTPISKPLLIEFGPGEFKPVSCLIDGTDITFKGAGTETTTLTGVLNLDACTNATKWTFHDLSVKSFAIGGNAVTWIGSGITEWHNVVLEGSSTGWYDTGGDSSGDNTCAQGEQGTHRFFSSRIISHGGNGKYGFLNSCGDDWFWGSEIQMITSNPDMVAIRSFGAGNRMHIYGSNIRVELADNAGTYGTITAIKVMNGAELHSHGNGIDVIAKPGWHAIALNAESLGQIHADSSAYSFGSSTSGINITRILNNGGHIHAPYQWATHENTPVITSVDGADTAVVTTIGGTPKFMIYSTTCTSKWFDVGSNICKP
jgi:hypothetical protein